MPATMELPRSRSMNTNVQKRWQLNLRFIFFKILLFSKKSNTPNLFSPYLSKKDSHLPCPLGILYIILIAGSPKLHNCLD